MKRKTIAVTEIRKLILSKASRRTHACSVETLNMVDICLFTRIGNI